MMVNSITEDVGLFGNKYGRVFDLYSYLRLPFIKDFRFNRIENVLYLRGD